MVEHTYFLPAELYPVAPVGAQNAPGVTVAATAPFGAVESGEGAVVVPVAPEPGDVAGGVVDEPDPNGVSATPHGAADVPAQMPFSRLAMKPCSLWSMASPQRDFTATQFDRYVQA